MPEGVYIWFSEKYQRWIFQVTFRDASGKLRKIQRRANSQKEAKRRAIDLARSPSLKRQPGENLTLGDFLIQYIQNVDGQLRPSSLANNLHIVNLYIAPTFGKTRLVDITPSLISLWMRNLRVRGLRAGTINTARAKLSTLLNHAFELGLVLENPVAKTKPMTNFQEQPSVVQEPWTLEESKAALAAFSGHWLLGFVTIALLTGMRKGEILALTWRDLDFEKRTIRVNKSRGERRAVTPAGHIQVVIAESQTKTRSSNRTLFMPDQIFTLMKNKEEALKQSGLFAPDAHVITGQKGAPLAPSYLAKAFNQVLENNGLRRIRIHDIRHTSAVLALEAGAPMEEVSQGFGHSGMDITKRTYAPVVPALSERFVKRLSDFLR